MKRIKYIVAFVFFSGFFLWVLFYFFPPKRVVNIVSNETQIQNPYSGQIILNELSLNYKYVNSSLDKFYLYNSIGDSVFAESFFHKNAKKWLVFRFSDDYCSSCVKKCVDLLVNDSVTIDRNDVLFLGYCNNNRVFNSRIEQYGLTKYNCFLSPRFLSPIDDYSTPYFFVIDNNMVLRGIYLPTLFDDSTDSLSLNLLYKSLIVNDD